jgi:hypothetical protein
LGVGYLLFAKFELFIAVGPIISSRATLGKAVSAKGFGPVSRLQVKVLLLRSNQRSSGLSAAGDLRITPCAADETRAF